MLLNYFYYIIHLLLNFLLLKENIQLIFLLIFLFLGVHISIFIYISLSLSIKKSSGSKWDVIF